MTVLDDLRELAAELRLGGDEYAAVRIETVIAKHEPPQPASDPRPRLTEPQAKILAFIKTSVAVHSRPPTLREICERFGYRSTNGADDHLVALERKGYIAREKLVSRGIRVIP
jgi:repressor LexA